MSIIEVHSTTQRIVVSYTQRIVVENKVVTVINTSEAISIMNAGPVGPPGINGIDGVNGTDGIDGTPAARRWYGEGPPGTVIGAAPGDEYVDILTGDLYILQ